MSLSASQTPITFLFAVGTCSDLSFQVTRYTSVVYILGVILFMLNSNIKPETRYLLLRRLLKKQYSVGILPQTQLVAVFVSVKN